MVSQAFALWLAYPLQPVSHMPRLQTALRPLVDDLLELIHVGEGRLSPRAYLFYRIH